MHLRSHDHTWSPTPRKLSIGLVANLYLKMFETLLMSSITTIQTTLKTMFTALAEQLVLGEGVQPSRFLLQTMPSKLVISSQFCKIRSRLLTHVSERWPATLAVAAAVVEDMAVAAAIVAVVVVVSPLPMLHLSAGPDTSTIGSMPSEQIGR